MVRPTEQRHIVGRPDRANAVSGTANASGGNGGNNSAATGGAGRRGDVEFFGNDRFDFADGDGDRNATGGTGGSGTGAGNAGGAGGVASATATASGKFFGDGERRPDRWCGRQRDLAVPMAARVRTAF